MNCKPGDLTIVVHSCKQQGRITRCIRLATEEDAARQGMYFPNGRPVWVVEHEFQYTTRRATLILDSFLRPIRDSDGEDQMLTRAGKPSDIKTPVAA